MWYVCDVLYAVLYAGVCRFVVNGCAVSRRYINVCKYDMFSVVCINGQMYVCCNECNVVSRLKKIMGCKLSLNTTFMFNDIVHSELYNMWMVVIYIA